MIGRRSRPALAAALLALITLSGCGLSGGNSKAQSAGDSPGGDGLTDPNRTDHAQLTGGTLFADGAAVTPRQVASTSRPAPLVTLPRGWTPPPARTRCPQDSRGLRYEVPLVPAASASLSTRLSLTDLVLCRDASDQRLMLTNKSALVWTLLTPNYTWQPQRARTPDVAAFRMALARTGPAGWPVEPGTTLTFAGSSASVSVGIADGHSWLWQAVKASEKVIDGQRKDAFAKLMRTDSARRRAVVECGIAVVEAWRELEKLPQTSREALQAPALTALDMAGLGSQATTCSQQLDRAVARTPPGEPTLHPSALRARLAKKPVLVTMDEAFRLGAQAFRLVGPG